MKKYLLLGIGLLLVIGLVSAYRGDASVGPDYSEERHDEMTTVSEEKDYDTWSNLMQGKGRVTDVVNQNNFDKFAEMHTAMINGDTETANEIRAELGLGQGRQGGRQGKMQRNDFVDADNDGICDNMGR